MYLLDTSVNQMLTDLLETVIPRSAARDKRNLGKGSRYYQFVSQKMGTDESRKQPLPFLAIVGLLLVVVAVAYAVAAV